LDVIDEIVHRDQLTNMVAFHSQQAVEKIYKSITEEFEELSLLKNLHKKSVAVDSLDQFKEVMAKIME